MEPQLFETYLFIGGSLDGQYLSIDKTLYRYVIDQLVDPPPIADLWSLVDQPLMELRCKQYLYTKRRYRDSPEQYLDIYIGEDCNNPLQLLVQNYHPTK